MKSEEQFYTDLSLVMRTAFPDREYSGPVGPETCVFGDIGLASIDLIVLAEQLESYYGRKLPFAAFLNDLRKQGADDVNLGTLVAFLQQQLR